MKKVSPLFILALIFMFAISGCSDEDDNGNGITAPPFSEEDFAYFFSIVNVPDRGTFALTLVNYQGDPINTVTVTVNGADVPMAYIDTMFVWMGNVQLDVDQNYDFTLGINNSEWSYNLLVPATPAVNWPQTIDFSEEWELDWTLTPDVDSQVQTLVALSFDYDNMIVDDEVALLGSDDRDYEFPGDWLSAGEMLYVLTMAETNYFMDLTLLTVLVNQETAMYQTVRSGYKIVSPPPEEFRRALIRSVR